MNKPFSIKTGELTKYVNNQKRNVMTRKLHLYHLWYAGAFFVTVVLTYYIFKNSIQQKDKLSETIALGSIFATFGSSLVAVFSLKMSSEYERFQENIRILYSDLVPEYEWHRWPFIRRESHQILYNGEFTYQLLKNTIVTFNVGSHEISINLPTIKEDFYDLANWKSLFVMYVEIRDYQSYVLKNVSDPAEALTLWDCIYDNFVVIARYRLSKFLVLIGDFLILLSIIFAFFFRYMSI